MPANQAAYQPAKQAPSLVVSEAPYPIVGEGQIVVRNAAVAVNLIDRRIQSRGDIMFTYLKYPFVLGFDMAGEVVEVGKGVTRFAVGDRVLGFSRAAEESINNSAEGAFQQYAILRQDYVSPIPDEVAYEDASVVPLGFATASAALFDKTQLGLDMPRQPARPATGQTVLVWGGSTSVGCNAVQLAVAAGYEVFATASSKNFQYLRKLGAARVFDYNSSTVVDDVLAALTDKVTAGALSIADGAAEKCMSIMAKSNGNRFVAMVAFPLSETALQSMGMMRTVLAFASWMISYKLRGAIRGVKSSLVSISPILDDGTGKYLFNEFLPEALRAGTFLPAPAPLIVGKDLEHLQKGFDLQKEGVSARKLVVTL